MIHLHLTVDQERELERRLRQRSPSPVPALRLEMVRLAAQGWRIPRIAQHLGCHEQTARKFVKAFPDEGFADSVPKYVGDRFTGRWEYRNPVPPGTKSAGEIRPKD